MLKGLYILGANCQNEIYPEDLRQEIAKRVEIIAPPMTNDTCLNHPELLAQADVIFSGWGAPKLDAAFLAACPKLKAFFYGAGSVRGFITDATWERQIQVTNANNANGISVVEYTIGAILFSLKLGWFYVDQVRRQGSHSKRRISPGAFRSTVGIISLGQIGQQLAKHLQAFDMKVIAYDPFVSQARAAELGVTMTDLDALFDQSDVVTLHAPNLPSTKGLINGSHFARLKPNATFINTARGAIVVEPDLIAALQARPDVTAVLDVTDPEPPVAGSPLYTLPNVILTPHIAGSIGMECARHGYQMLAELDLYLAGKPMQFLVTPERFAIMA